MKYVLLLLIICLCGCSQKIEQTLDPILKTQLVLKAIQNNQHEQIRDAIFDAHENQDAKEQGISMDTIIKNNLDEYGLPNRSQIIVYHEKNTADHYRKLRKPHSKDVIKTIAKLGGDKASITIAYIAENKDLKILYYEPN